MTSSERKLVLAMALVGAFVLFSAALVAGGLIALNQGWVHVAFRSGSPVSVSVATSSQSQQGSTAVGAAPTSEPTAGPSIFDRLTQSGMAGRQDLPLRAPKVDIGSDLSTLYDQVNPGVVSVIVTKGGGATINGVPFESQGAGSGFVYDREHVVTNNHVTDGAQSIEVLFYDGQRREGTLVGSDVYSDLAVIKVTDMPDTARVLPVARDLSQLRVGQPVVAIGNPFEKANSMTYGIVSAVGRTIPDGQTSFSIPEAIQTDAAINPGNSGGPLLDLRGEVVGVNAQINTSNIQSGGVPANSGVGFAIPASVVNRVAPALIRDGAYEWPYLGVSGGSLDLDEAEAAGLTDTRGAYIQCVPTGGPSDGILEGSTNVDCATQRVLSGDAPVGGDIVVAIDGQPVTSFEDLLSYIGLRTEPGQEVRLTVLRDGAQQDVTVRLGRRSDMQQQ